MDSKQIAEAAAEIAARHAFKYASNHGTPDAFTFAVRVQLSGNDVLLFAACNAQISERRASAELRKVYGALKAVILASGTEARFIKTRGYAEWRAGFWNMGRFCTTDLVRGIKTVAAENESAA
jgi:hypothetical protein